MCCKQIWDENIWWWAQTQAAGRTETPQQIIISYLRKYDTFPYSTKTRGFILCLSLHHCHQCQLQILETDLWWRGEVKCMDLTHTHAHGRRKRQLFAVKFVSLSLSVEKKTMVHSDPGAQGTNVKHQRLANVGYKMFHNMHFLIIFALSHLSEFWGIKITWNMQKYADGPLSWVGALGRDGVYVCRRPVSCSCRRSR